MEYSCNFLQNSLTTQLPYALHSTKSIQPSDMMQQYDKSQNYPTEISNRGHRLPSDEWPLPSLVPSTLNPSSSTPFSPSSSTSLTPQQQLYINCNNTNFYPQLQQQPQHLFPSTPVNSSSQLLWYYYYLYSSSLKNKNNNINKNYILKNSNFIMSDQQQRQRTTSPPQPSPQQQLQQLQQQPSSSTSGGASSSSTVQQQPNLSNEQWAVFINQRMSGMPNATTLAEWQLQAVLFHAKLTQYYDRFISLGGDDIDQLMQCDETEFLEIMRLIGMASKPLHVRRFQRTLADFSKDRATFLRQAAVHIGPPPVMDLPTSSQTSSLQAAIQFLSPIPSSEHPTSTSASTTSITTALTLPGSSSGMPIQQQQQQVMTSVESPVTATMPRLYPQTTSTPFFRPQLQQQQQPSTSTMTSMIAGASATANAVPYSNADLFNLVGASISTLTIPSISPSVATPISSTTAVPSSSRTESPAIAGPSGCGSNQSIASPGSDTEYTSDPFEGGVLPDSDITQISRLSRNLYSKKPDLHNLEPRYVQNKKKLPKELIDAMRIPPEEKNRLSEFRKFSAIYGRYDAKRKPDKPLSYHELLVNEAAAQLCLIQPVLLTRRDELFPLARQVVRESNFPGFRTMSRTERKRPYDTKSERSTSPHSVASNRNSPELSTLERRSSSSHPKHDPSPNTPPNVPSSSKSAVIKRAKSEH